MDCFKLPILFVNGDTKYIEVTRSTRIEQLLESLRKGFPDFHQVKLIKGHAELASGTLGSAGISGCEDPSCTLQAVVVSGVHLHCPGWQQRQRIPGLLHDARRCGKYYVRKGLFQPLFAHRAVVLSNGNNAISDIKSSVFITGEVADPQARSFENVCPEISARVADVDADRAANGLTAFTWPTSNHLASGRSPE